VLASPANALRASLIPALKRAMTTTRSGDEIRAGYISSMGNELGSAFFSLYAEVVQLHVVWQQYRQLFGTDHETVELLNRTAGLFFKIVQDQIWDSVLLGISRLTDPPGSGARTNLTLRSLPLLLTDPALKFKVEALCEIALERADFARQHRNKRIAHQDHRYSIDRASHELSGISRELVEAMLASIRDVMNCLDQHFRDTTVFYEGFIDDTDARVLVAKLRKLERLEHAAATP